MILHFTLYIPGFAPDADDIAIDASVIYAVVTNETVGGILIAVLNLRSGENLVVYDLKRDAQQRWAEASGDFINDAE